MSDRLTKIPSIQSGQTRGKRLTCIPGIGKAATLVMLQPSAPAREPTAWMHAPSQPLMRSLLSQIQTPTAPRRTSRFFRVWLLVRSPCRADHSAYFGVARFISPILSAVDASQTKQSLHRCQRNSQRENEISVYGIVENVDCQSPSCFPFGRHRAEPLRNSTQAPQENRHETASRRILSDSQINVVLWAGTHAQIQTDQAWSSAN